MNFDYSDKARELQLRLQHFMDAEIYPVEHAYQEYFKTAANPWASPPLILSTLLICGIAIALPYSPLAGPLQLTALPALYWPIVASFLVCYAVLTTIVKSWFIRRWGM